MPNLPTPIVLQLGPSTCVFDPQRASLISLQHTDAINRDVLAAVNGGDASEPLFHLDWEPPVQEPRRWAAWPSDGESRLTLLSCTETRQCCTVSYRVEEEGGDGARRAAVTVTLRLTDEGELLLSLAVENESLTETIREVIFPVISGIRVEARAEDETLYYPFYSGAKIVAPRIALLQGRHDAAKAAPLSPGYTADGSAVVRHLYSGDLSMSWLTVAGRGGGVAVLHYDPQFEVSSLAVYAANNDAGVAHALHVAVSNLRPLLPGQARELAPTGVLPYEGTWHRAADRYRRWLQPLLLTPRVPDWVRESHALTAHYDFKWEDGTFTHTFRDIPALYRRTAQDGVTHLFLAGWFTGGFDHMYPEFYPDLDLGTVMDFIDGVRTVRAEGGQCTFYINGTLFGKASRFYNTLGTRWAVKDPQGRTVDRTFFGRDFVITCRGVDDYRRHLKDTARWLVGEVGASGVYIDTFAAMGPHLCFDASHGHPHPAHWNRDSIAAIRQVEDGIRQANREAFSMIEGCSDVYGQWVGAHLIQAWYYMNSYPEMFRYTFPHYVLVDMVYPSQGQNFRPQRISREARDQLHRTWVNGCILWMYDQEDNRFCNFRSDPELWQYIKRLLALREKGKQYFAYATFVDDIGVETDGNRVVVKRYMAPDDNGRNITGDMLAVWNKTGERAAFAVAEHLTARWQSLGIRVLQGVTVDGEELTVPLPREAGAVEVHVPKASAALLFARPVQG